MGSYNFWLILFIKTIVIVSLAFKVVSIQYMQASYERHYVG